MTQENYTTDSSFEQQEPQQTQAWYSSLPPELQSEASRFKSLPDLVKGYASARELIGKKVQDFSQQNFETYNAMVSQYGGIPATENNYDIAVYEDSDNMRNLFDENDLSVLKKIAHDNHLTNDQAQNLYDTMNEYLYNAQLEWVDKMNAQMEDVRKQTQEHLSQVWGSEYDNKVQALQTCVNDIIPKLTGYSPEDIANSLSGIDFNPVLATFLAQIGSIMTEKRSVGYNNVAPVDAKVKLDQIYSDPATREILGNINHPRHRELQNELMSLVRMRDGGR